MEEAALREALEEAGVRGDLQVLPNLLITFIVAVVARTRISLEFPAFFSVLLYTSE